MREHITRALLQVRIMKHSVPEAPALSRLFISFICDVKFFSETSFTRVTLLTSCQPCHTRVLFRLWPFLEGFMGYGCKYSELSAFSIRNNLKTRYIGHYYPVFCEFPYNQQNVSENTAWSVKKLGDRVCDRSDRFSIRPVTVATVIAWENIHLTPALEFTRLKTAFSPHADLNPLVSQ